MACNKPGFPDPGRAYPRHRYRYQTEIQKLVLKLADEGKSLIFISSEIEEMLRTCNRMAVLRDGQKVGEIDEADMNQMNVMKAIAGGEQ